MFNAKKKRIKQLEAALEAYRGENTRWKEYAEGVIKSSDQKVEMANYKLGLVEQLMKQLTININMNGKKK